MSITNAGMAQFSSLLSNSGTNAAFIYIAYGSGTTAASAAQTALVSETKRVAASVYKISVLSPLDTLRIYGTDTATAARTISEIGVFDDDTAGNMLLRKLVSPVETAAIGDVIFLLADVTSKDGGYSFAS